MVGSSCADPATCAAECESGVVVACDRGGPLMRDPTERAAIYRRGGELWDSLCNFGNPEACINGAKDVLRGKGIDNPTADQMLADHDACPLYGTYAAGNGTPMKDECP